MITFKQYLLNEDAKINDKKLNDVPKSCALLSLPVKYRPLFKALSRSVSNADLYIKDGDFGKETEPHVTALYGLLNHNYRPVKELVKKFGSIPITFNKLSLFENEKFDVLKIEVKGKRLNELNKLLCSLPYYNSYDKYNPHMTIAYLKKGKGKKYLTPSAFDGLTIDFKTLIFSPPSDGGLRKKLGRRAINLCSK